MEIRIEEMEAMIAPMGIGYRRVYIEGIGHVYLWDTEIQ